MYTQKHLCVHIVCMLVTKHAVFWALVIEIFKKLYSRLVHHIQKFGLFCDFQYGFRASWSTADLLAVVSDRIVRAFNRSGATWAVVLDMSKVFDWVWYAGLLHKLKSARNSGLVSPLFCLFLVINESFLVVVNGKSLQEYSVSAVSTLLLLYINDVMMLSVILLLLVMIFHFTPSLIKHLICGNN